MAVCNTSPGFNDDYRLLDKLLGELLSKAFRDKEVTNENEAVDLLLCRGLCLDGEHACCVVKAFVQSLSNKSSDDDSLYEERDLKIKTSLTNKKIENPAECGNLDENPPSKKYSVDTLEESSRACIKRLYPGALPQNRGPPLQSGVIVKLSASGHWLLRRSEYFTPMNGMRRFLRKIDVCLKEGEPVQKARSWKIDRVSDKNAVENEPLRYGEILRLTSDTFTVKAKLVCPGRLGSICIGDYFYLLEVSESEKGPFSQTWTLNPSNTFGNVIPIKQISRCRRSFKNKLFSDVSPLLVRCHHNSDTSIDQHDSESSESQEALNAEAVSDVDISVMVYNAWLMPRVRGLLDVANFLGADFCPGKVPRSKAISDAILRSFDSECEKYPDVVVLCEAFCDQNSTRLKAGLKRKLGLLFETPTCGSGRFVSIRSIANGGVTIVSRYPIVSNISSVYSSWAGDDGLSNKGLTIARIRNGNFVFNILGTHLQAWEYNSAKKARRRQLQHIAQFVDKLTISKEEPLVFAGDLNVCRVSYPEEYVDMLNILDAEDTNTLAEDFIVRARQLSWEHRSKKSISDVDSSSTSSSQTENFMHADVTCVKSVFSFNTIYNTLAMTGHSTSGHCGLLDYVLTSKKHLPPKIVSSKIIHSIRSEMIMQSEGSKKRNFYDLSDHYPVISRLKFERPVVS